LGDYEIAAQPAKGYDCNNLRFFYQKKNYKNHHKKNYYKKLPLLLALPYHYHGTSRSSEHQWARGAECP
jgi:hypothetical protein